MFGNFQDLSFPCSDLATHIRVSRGHINVLLRKGRVRVKTWHGPRCEQKVVLGTCNSGKFKVIFCYISGLEAGRDYMFRIKKYPKWPS